MSHIGRRILALALFLLVGFTSIAAARELPLVITNNDGEPVVELARFFAQFDWRSDGSEQTVRRIRPLFYLGHGPCRGKVELNLAATELVNDVNGNWVEIAALECAASKTLKLSAGRLALSTLYSTEPAFLLRTVEYPGAVPFKAYAYGLQLQRTFGAWGLMVDVSGNSGRDFGADGNFDRLESSLRVGRKFGALGTVSVTGQFAEDMTRAGLDWMSDQSQKLHIWAGVYYDDTIIVPSPQKIPPRYPWPPHSPHWWLLKNATHKTESRVSGMVQTSYTIGSYLRPHVMWDARPDGSEEWTVGAEFFFNPSTQLIVDREANARRWLVRLQFHP